MDNLVRILVTLDIVVQCMDLLFSFFTKNAKPKQCLKPQPQYEKHHTSSWYAKTITGNGGKKTNDGNGDSF